MKSFKMILALVCALMMAVLPLAGTAEEPVHVYGLKGPTGIGMVRMMENGQYTFTLSGAPTEVVAAITSKQADIAALPTNLAATLYNKTNGNVQLLALNTLGVLYILEKGDTVQSVSDLAGKTLWMTGAGSTPEYALNYILSSNGIADQVTIEVMGEHAELATMAASGKVDLCLLPEPHVTSVLMKNPEYRVALDVTALYQDAAAANGFTDAQMSMGCIVVRKDFADANPEAVAAFMKEYAESVAFVNANVDEAAELVVKYEIMGAVPAAKKAIPNCHIVCVTGSEMKTAVEPFFEVLYQAEPSSVGGRLPGADFYFGVQE